MKTEHSRYSSISVTAWLVVVTLIASCSGAPVAGRSTAALAAPEYTVDGALVRPEHYREWIYVGTPLTPNDMNNGEAPFPEFHNVYIHPLAWEHYKETGTFMDGTILVKELVSVGSKKATSGNGYFMGDFIGLEATVKDSNKFPDAPGHWAYFSYGHSYPLATESTALPAANCNSCHENSAAEDWVFTQYYPVLAAAKNGGPGGAVDSGPRFNEAGELIRPEGYREWIFVGTPTTPNDMNNGSAPFPEFHNVYISPEAWTHYKSTGEWMDGTILVKELVDVGSKRATSGKGYFMNDFIGLEATVKDSERFPDEPGHWAYFSFGHEYPLAEATPAMPTTSCNTCHELSAASDFVFTQYYPVIRSAREPASRSTAAMAKDKKFLPTADTPDTNPGPVPTNMEELYDYLSKGTYKEFAAQESGRHPSVGPHIKVDWPVKVFLDDSLDASLKAGNASHPSGSAAVKEMFNESGELQGWGVMVKTSETDGGGKDWFWMEVTSPTDDSDPVAVGNGVPLCTSCHSIGSDFVLTDYPLR